MNKKTARYITILFAVSLLLCSATARAGVTNSNRPEIFCEFSSNQAPVDRTQVRIYLDGEDVTAGAKITSWRVSYVPLAPLAAGAHRVRVAVGDARGGNGEKEWTFTVDASAADTTPPRIAFAALTPENGENIVEGTAVAIAVSSSENGEISKQNISLTFIKDGAPAAMSFVWLHSDNVLRTSDMILDPGRYEIRAKASDAAGNTSNEIITAFSIKPNEITQTESLPPGLPELRRRGDFYLDDLPEFVKDSEIRVTGRAPAGVEVTLLVNGAPSRITIADLSGAFSFSGVLLLDGENTVAAARDSSGDPLGNQTPESIVTLDRTPPAIFDYLPGAADISADRVALGFSFTDSESGAAPDSARLQIDGADANLLLSGNCAIFETTLEPGQHHAAAGVCDAVGNCAAATWGFVVPDAPVAQNPDVDPWDKPDIDQTPPGPNDPAPDNPPEPGNPPEPADDPEPEPDAPLSVICDILNENPAERGKEVHVRCEAPGNSVVSLFVNDILAEKTELRNGQTQAVFHKIELKPGINVITASAEHDGLTCRGDPVEVFVEESDDGKKNQNP